MTIFIEVASRRLPEEPVDAVVAGGAADLALADEVMNMRQRLAEREAGLVAVEPALEKDRHQFGRAVRPGAGGDHLRTARVVMRGQLVDPRMDAAERQIV